MLNDSQIARLLDIANAGCHKGMVQEARAVYEGVLVLRPGHVPALIGQALSHIVLGEYAQAEDILRSGVLAGHPGDADAGAMLGLCLFLSGRKDEAEPLLRELAGEEGSAAALASSLLEQLN